MRYLLKSGFDAKYTMLETLEQNKMMEKKKEFYTFDIVQCMLINSPLPKFLWGRP